MMLSIADRGSIESIDGERIDWVIRLSFHGEIGEDLTDRWRT